MDLVVTQGSGRVASFSVPASALTTTALPFRAPCTKGHAVVLSELALSLHFLPLSATIELLSFVPFFSTDVYLPLQLILETRLTDELVY